MSSGRFIAILAFSSVLLASCARDTRRHKERATQVPAKSAVNQGREPLIDCSDFRRRAGSGILQPEAILILEDIHREIAATYSRASGEIDFIENARKYIQEHYLLARDRYIGVPHWSLDYERLHKEKLKVIGTFVLLARDFDTRLTVEFIQAFLEDIRHDESSFAQLLRNAIAHNLASMRIPTAKDALFQMARLDTNNIAIISLICKKDQLSPNDRDLLYHILLQALSSSDHTSVAMAAEALGDLGDKRAIPVLQATLEDFRGRVEEYNIKKIVNDALSRLQP